MKHSTLWLGAITLAGCATLQIPVTSLEHNEASIRSAEELGASAVPNAKLHLQMAKDQTEQAKKLALSGDKRATTVLARAESDAELALHLAREATVHADALRAAEDLKVVQSRPTP